MKPGRRFLLLRVLVHALRLLRATALVLLGVTVWGVTFYVCGRQAMMITDEGARSLMRQVLPGIW